MAVLRSFSRLLLAIHCVTGAGAYAGSYAFPVGLAAAAELLDITLPSSRAGVRAAYRKKAATTHPDISPHAEAAADFLRVTTAYELLLQFSLSAAAAPRGHHHHGAHAAAATQPAAAAYGDRPDAEAFARRVAAWRVYWAAAMQAEQVASEAHRVAVQQAALAGELQELRAQLDTLLAQQQRQQRASPAAAAARLIDRCRAQYAYCAGKHADAQSAVLSLQARVRALREEATRLQGLAQRATA